MRAAWTARGAGPARRPDAGMAARAVLVVLSGYKLLCSPLFTGSCRVTPSCSTYMADAVRVVLQAEHRARIIKLS